MKDTAHSESVLAFPPSTISARKNVGRTPHCRWRRKRHPRTRGTREVRRQHSMVVNPMIVNRRGAGVRCNKKSALLRWGLMPTIKGLLEDYEYSAAGLIALRVKRAVGIQLERAFAASGAANRSLRSIGRDDRRL